MVFSSFIFLFLFLPLTFLVYFTSPRAFRNSILLLVSLIFYGWGAPNMIIPLIVSCAIDFALSKKIAPQVNSLQIRKRYLFIAVGLNVVLLGYFKYANFFVEQLSSVLEIFGATSLVWTKVVLPIGISFFTFHKISYLVDVYRGDSKVARSLFDFILYVILFPQLIAGPIIRYKDVANEIVQRESSLDLFLAGLRRFIFGLAKKVLIADAMGSVADSIFKLPIEQLSTSWAWIGIIAYAFQIYFDFSGYSDMAIGLGWCLGFHFKENFMRPYLSQNITDFWRRWHISLSSFMREYLYIPLGGSRGSRWSTYRNLWLVFLISGLWHGAAWNFIIWGAYHGAFLVIDKVFWLRFSQRIPRFINVALTFLIVLFGWVLFRSSSLFEALNYSAVMLGIHEPTSNLLLPRAMLIDNRSIFVLCIAALLSFVPKFRIEPIAIVVADRPLKAFSYCAQILFLLILSTAYLASRGYTPFLYFRF